MTTVSEQAFLQEFGKLFISAQADPRDPTPDRAALDFARYLQAARVNAGLSRETLAARAGLTPALMVALELAALPADSLSWQQVTALAQALGAEVELLALLLERDLPEPAPASALQQLRRAWDSLVAYVGTPAQAWTALALSLTAFGGAVLAAGLGLSAPGSALANQPAWAGAVNWIRGFITAIGPPYWSGSQAGLYAPLTLIGVLLLLFAWLLLANHDLPARWAHIVHRRPNLLLNGTALIIVLLVFVAGLNHQLPANARLGSIEQRAATTSLASLSPPLQRIRITNIEVSPMIRSRFIVFDSLEGIPRAIPSVAFGSITNRASLDQQRHPPAPGLVNTTTMERAFTRQSNQIDSRVSQIILVCQAVCVGLLYTVIWRVVRRVGRWRRVAAAQSAHRRRPG